MSVPTGFMWSRQAPSDWTRALATLAPQSELVPWLHLAWLSGDPWGPVQRWGIYELVPLRVWWGLIQAQRQKGKKEDEIWEWDILKALEGPHPRDLGHYDSILQRFVSEAGCTRQEWELFREHKAIPKLFWVIQGERGGHQRFFTRLQQRTLKYLGLPEDPPEPGSLCYAEWDTRVLDLVSQHQRLREIERRLPENQEMRAPMLVEARRIFVNVLEDQMHEQLQAQAISLDGIARTSDDPTEMIERRINRYVETGSMKPQTEDV